jgi:hypothetical protein
VRLEKIDSQNGTRRSFSNRTNREGNRSSKCPGGMIPPNAAVLVAWKVFRLEAEYEAWEQLRVS